MISEIKIGETHIGNNYPPFIIAEMSGNHNQDLEKALSIVDAAALEGFFAAGYDKATLIDTLVLIGDKTISNFVHGVTQVPIDFPLAPELEPATV